MEKTFTRKLDLNAIPSTFPVLNLLYTVTMVMSMLYNEPTYKEEDYPTVTISYKLLMRYVLESDFNDPHVVTKVKFLCEKIKNKLNKLRFIKCIQHKWVFIYCYEESYAEYCEYKKLTKDNK